MVDRRLRMSLLEGQELAIEPLSKLIQSDVVRKEEAMRQLRRIAVCSATGQAVGTAAPLAMRDSVTQGIRMSLGYRRLQLARK